MNKLELIPIRESDRMEDEMLSFIMAGTTPPPVCKENSCSGNSGSCATVNTCSQNTGSCDKNGCQINQ